ncbi:beta-glucan synthesis-associated [Pseudovirgaria hyperparasitica]|uniref:Beta-glucan synthesis-associated n=1 Tax=Pseudovirgaria hyperparasitica TaxID=470096 RepID=A0A6A6WCV9_9PEZI|nr:beta-glucan synthesis-associated [Pseudovirgaria hyperparasitica]KAF2760672.1 beta-glucan synthesis-associated [Pseudovirgaria hyperparasitica]
MSPLQRPPAPRLDSDADMRSTDRLNSQSGRSASSLNAEVASSRLRSELQRPHLSASTSPSASSTSLAPHDHQHSSPSSSESIPPINSFAYNPCPTESGNSVRSSSESRSSDDGSSADYINISKSQAAQLSLPPSRRGHHERPLSRRPGIGPIQEQSPYLKATPPMSVRDLGSDYTRYFNPFSDSRRSSWVSLGGASTPLAARSTGSLSLSSTPLVTPGLGILAASSTSKLVSTDFYNEKSFSPWMDDRLAAPFSDNGGYKFPLFNDEKEDDDDMHMPMADDDIRLKPSWRDHLSRENIASTVGLAMMLTGLLFVFVAMPALSYRGIWSWGSTYRGEEYPKPEPWAIVNNKTYPILSNVRRTLIDPDTPEDAKTRTDINGDELILVFSDEFNEPNRTFYPGDDPYFFAPDFWYGATMDLEWYDPDAATTWDGTLELQMDQFPNHGLNLRSGMLNTWNQLCFKGGVFEVSISLPGPGGVMGYWPGAWAMGNLGRPGYMATTDGLWPYTYNDCDAGITPNQSMADGTSRLPGQRLNSCTCKGEDHPTPGTGRGAPEIDILEGSTNGRGLGVVTQSFQVAPFDIFYYADYDYLEYPDYSLSFPNTWTGGPFQQAVSATSNLNNNWYDGKQYQKYAFEYVPGSGESSYIAWYIGDDVTFKMNADAVRPNGNSGQRIVAEEPMSLVLNFGMSTNWAFIDWEHLVFPAVMRVDYVRWYQPKGSQSVTCDPPGFETTEYIANHPEAYNNINKTLWSQTSYKWPKNTLMDGCET